MWYKTNTFKNGTVKRFLCLEPAALLVIEELKIYKTAQNQFSCLETKYVKITLSHSHMATSKDVTPKFHSHVSVNSSVWQQFGTVTTLEITRLWLIAVLD